MNKENNDPKDKKNKKTMFDRLNKKTRSKKDNLDPTKNGERHNAEKPPETGQGKVTW